MKTTLKDIRQFANKWNNLDVTNYSWQQGTELLDSLRNTQNYYDEIAYSCGVNGVSARVYEFVKPFEKNGREYHYMTVTSRNGNIFRF